MKKTLLFAAICCIAAITFFACQKGGVEVTTPTQQTTSGCTDSAYVWADSVFTSCGNKTFLFIIGKNKTILVNNPIPAMDTLVNGAKFHVSYDSVGTEACGGAIYTKADVTCYQRY